MVDLGKAMRSKVEEAINKTPKLGLRNIAWDCAFTMIPTPQGVQPAYAIFVQCSSMVLGQTVPSLAIIGDLNADQTEVNKVVDQTLDNLRAAYAKSGAVANGQEPTPGGLQHG